MNQKQLGLTLICLGLLLTLFIYLAKEREDFYVDTIIESQGGVCYVDGTCLHEREYMVYYFGGILSAALLILGVYLIFFSKSQELLLQQHKEVASALKDAQEKDAFHAYVAGFSQEEQKVLRAVREQEGIQQSTLRYRTGIAKTSLSLLLKSLEERGVISKKEHGKTNQVFLVRKF